EHERFGGSGATDRQHSESRHKKSFHLGRRYPPDERQPFLERWSVDSTGAAKHVWWRSGHCRNCELSDFTRIPPGPPVPVHCQLESAAGLLPFNRRRLVPAGRNEAQTELYIEDWFKRGDDQRLE